jgi:hypothetical protein
MEAIGQNRQAGFGYKKLIRLVVGSETKDSERFIENLVLNT